MLLSRWSWRRNSVSWLLTMSAAEPETCCGQVAAVNGGGQVAGLNTLGLDNNVAPKRLDVSNNQPPGMRKLAQRKLSTRRRRSLTWTVTPKSAVAVMRRAVDAPVASKARWRV